MFALTVHDGIAECAPPTRAADIELDIDVLGSRYLGVYPARVFAAANRLPVKGAAQSRALDEAFGAERDVVPDCSAEPNRGCPGVEPATRE